MNTFWQDINYKIKSGSKLYLLIVINVVVYLLINLPGQIEKLFAHTENVIHYTYKYLALPAYLPDLIHRPWTIVSHMFMHADVFHILYNMLWFYWFGQIFEEFLGKKRTVGLYFIGGLSGAAFFITAYNLIPLFNQPAILHEANAIGASAAIMAIIIAAATIVPDYTMIVFLIGPVKLKWVALFFVVTDFLSITGPNAGGEIAHIGGAIVGFVYVKQLQNGKDWIGSINNLFKKRSKMRVVPGSQQKESKGKPQQDEIDRILDKISETGYDNLTTQEKDTLFRASNK